MRQASLDTEGASLVEMPLAHFMGLAPPTSDDLFNIRGVVKNAIVVHYNKPTADQEKTSIKSVKGDGQYAEFKETTKANWLEKATQDFSDWLRSLFHFDPPPINAPAQAGGVAVLLQLIKWLLILGVGALVIWVLVWLGRNAGRVKIRKRRGRLLVEDDELDIPVDEWIVKADDLIAKGEFREACRCLYVAILLRIDEYDVTNFVRTDTNWEHQNRYDQSPRRPELDLRPVTQTFDRIWYGFDVHGIADPQFFRQNYESLVHLLRRRAS